MLKPLIGYQERLTRVSEILGRKITSLNDISEVDRNKLNGTVRYLGKPEALNDQEIDSESEGSGSRQRDDVSMALSVNADSRPRGNMNT